MALPLLITEAGPRSARNKPAVRAAVEHPFGILKTWMRSCHFLAKTLEKVKTEMSLQVLAYNMKRMINIFGVKLLLQAIAA
jgi:hypothetical protein